MDISSHHHIYCCEVKHLEHKNFLKGSKVNELTLNKHTELQIQGQKKTPAAPNFRPMRSSTSGVRSSRNGIKTVEKTSDCTLFHTQILLQMGTMKTDSLHG
jgi:hypothetical protein